MLARFGLLAAVTLFAAAPSGAAAGAAGALDFDTVFSAKGEPAFLHYGVMFVSKGAVHRMAIWRDHDRLLKRDTDAALTTFAVHKPGDPAYQMIVLDRNRRISTRISRESLYRIGTFTDWFDLTHGLRHPKAAYTLKPGIAPVAPASMPRVPAPCAWYDLTQAGRVTRICWDADARVPELIVAGGHLVWRVVTLDREPIPASVFVVDDHGYVHDDADHDIDKD
jgi:hypothetical protein